VAAGRAARPAQLLADRRQQCRAGGDQLWLDLVPRGGRSIGRLGRHVVGGDLGERLASAVEQSGHAVAGLDAHHRRQRRGPDDMLAGRALVYLARPKVPTRVPDWL